MTFSITPSQGTPNVYIRCSETAFNELGIGVMKSGFILVQPSKAEELKAKLESGELKARFIGKPNDRNLYEVHVEAAVTSEVEQSA
jgi:hypothetical protein